MDRATKQEVKALVFAECERFGSIRKFAAAKKIPVSIVSQALNGTRDITDALAHTVGFMRDETFVPIHQGRNY